MKIIADITKAFRGSEKSILSSLGRFVDGTEAADIVAYCTAEQFAFVNQALPDAKYEVVEGSAGYPSIVGHVWNSIATIQAHAHPNHQPEIQVFSFHNQVLELANRFSHDPSVKFTRWDCLKPPQDLPTGASDRIDPLARFTLSKDDILVAVRGALSRHPNGCRLTDLRAYLSAERHEFDKSSGHFSDAPGFISAIVALAKGSDIVAIDTTQGPTNPWIRLSGNTPISGPIERNESEKPQPSPNSQAGNVISRSEQIQQAIGSTGFGPYTAVRPDLYNAIEELASTGTHSPSRLIHAAITKTKSTCSVNSSYPWWGVERFLRVILGKRQVLLDSSANGIDPNSPLGLGKKVHMLTEGWRDKLDAEILLSAIVRDRKVSAHDIVYIAGVMYGERTDSAIEKVEALFGILSGDERIYVDASETAEIPAFLPNEERQHASDTNGKTPSLSLIGDQTTENTSFHITTQTQAPLEYPDAGFFHR